ncbi:MAG: response regulator [Bacteroidales bacterium]|nr:response regulator [Bacteroidales bacterium]
MNFNKTVINKSVESNVNHNYKILVVEDDDIGYMLLHEILSSYPVKLVRAINGQEAIDNFQNDKSAFNLVLMDIRLPKVNGYVATRQIKKINPSIPIIAVTAYAHSQGIIDCFNSGCDEFIAKPFDIKRIIKVVENYLVFKN